MLPRTFVRLLVVAVALGLPAAHAQLEISATTFSRLYVAGVPNDADNTPPILSTQPQFAANLPNAGGAAARTTDATLSARYPSQIYVNPATGLPTGAAIVLQRSSFGTGYAAGVPRYLLGDVIVPPSTEANGVAAAASNYWRQQPVTPGEVFSHPAGGSSTPVAANATLSYYYSPHAERVFATQSGRVSVTWVSRVPVTVPGDLTLKYRFREETFAVSATTSKPTRTIYWTEKSFNGPIVYIPSGVIETVNPVYSANFPAQVAQEYQPVGVSTSLDPNNAVPAERRTLWFQKTAGVGELHAYNIEGRIFVEYLGALKPGASATHQFLGADIVEVVRVAPSVNVTVALGERITPRDSLDRLLPLDGSSEWLPAPVISASPGAQQFYGTHTRADGRQVYFAERENENPDRVVFYWLEAADAAITTGSGTASLGLYWPKLKNNYVQQWPTQLDAFAHNTVGAAGTIGGTGVQFPAGQLPQLVFQDEATQTEATIETTTQRLIVSFRNDSANRALLKFTNGYEVWYLRLFTQAEDRAGYLEGDGLPAIAASVSVGDRIAAPSGYSTAGFIQRGTGYLPSAYLDPFSAGVAAAERGAIIPVNALPNDNELRVVWFRRVEPPSAAFQSFYTPAKLGRYTVAYPANPALIVLASNAGSGDLAPAEIAGRIYVQNDRARPGFNPNEEHALLLAGRAYALRDDLNVTGSDPATYTSEPFVLLSYTALDQRPAMRVFKVQRELDLPGTADDRRFDYAVTAGTILQAPMPLPLLPLPVLPNGQVRNTEVPGTPDTAHAAPADLAPHYTRFTFQDRKGYHWVYRGPHANGTPTLGMQFYYPMREGFFVPGATPQPAVGTILPYLRPLVGGQPQGDPVSGTALTVVYRPAWPDNAPELRVAETLTLAKFGLPAVMPQASAQILYQQSVAQLGENRPSVVLHDPMRERTFTLGNANDLQRIPASALTSTYQGKTYFQRLPPHLQKRFFFDPLRGPKGTLVLQGHFVDETAGEDYLLPNVLSADDVAALHAIVAASDGDASRWRSAVDNLATVVETFVENTAKAGTFISNGTPSTISARQPIQVSDSDTAVVDYALTATGQGSGWVTLLFGNGRAFTPAGDPVALQVFRVAPRLHTGELKVQLSPNPLDEQVTLHHSGDFAARPEDYEFEWRYASPQGGVAPATYTFTLTSRLTGGWQFVSAPAAALPSAAEYSTAASITLPRALEINPIGFTGGGTRAGAVLRSTTALDFATGVPSRIIVSADLPALAGFVLYVNGAPALAFNAPASFGNVTSSTGLVADGLSRQFPVDGNFFQQGPNRLEFALFSTADPGTSAALDFRLHASSEIDLVVAGGSPWIAPNGTLSNRALVGGSPSAPLGSPLLLMSDNYFTVRYRPKASTNNVAGTAWSRWMPPKLVEGWIKRVLAAINPFNQRMRDLANNAVNTDVSLLTQAGKRWEGDIALTLENINDFGLIEIYETVLNRGRSLSVDAGYDFAPANDALLLAAGYLNDLYTILGHEAFADAANPTISIDDSATVTEVNTSRFAFESQVASVLEEELALLRGRDDFLAPSVAVAPAYNRLYWNFTRGVNSGEALYAVNYNIREKAGSSTADGVVDAADAQRMFPQGHGDAYGHYLTALKGYHRLLANPNFTWTPRSEAITVLGQTVQVDYFDERKFAAAAANLARTGQQIIALTRRQSYRDDSNAGWSHLRDGKLNSTTQNTRHWGVDDWTARATQGAYFHWLVGNAIVPDVDADPTHTGIQKIDRSTVPELAELATLGADFQTSLDNVSSRLNPLGLSPDAIAFDISPTELKAGKSHYEQIHERALRAVLNAKGAFDQAARMTRSLRNQENSVATTNERIVDQERAFVRQLIEIYGMPYPGEIGPGKIYPQGYAGPDVQLWFLVDRSGNEVDSRPAITLSGPVPSGHFTFAGLSVSAINAALNSTDSSVRQGVTRTFTIQPDRIVQFADQWQGGAALGQRAVTGQLQQALLEVHSSRLAAVNASTRVRDRQAAFEARHRLFLEMLGVQEGIRREEGATEAEIQKLQLYQLSLRGISGLTGALSESSRYLGLDLSEYFPKIVGTANDATSSTRAAIQMANTTIGKILKVVSVGASASAELMAALQNRERADLEKTVRELKWSYEQSQAAFEYELLLRDYSTSVREFSSHVAAVQRATERVRNLMAEGDRILAEREIFRQRAAALIQGYRTRDLTFRTFRNEALEQYRSLLDLASRYTYLSAKSYDYETGLLGSTAGRTAIAGIVSSRALGDLTGGQPQATVSTLGDAGLAGTMARLQADWSVAKPRLGINNPDTNGTLFSLRRELFRILDDPATTVDDTQWQQTLEQHIMSDVLADEDVAAYARNLRQPDGRPVLGIVIPFSTTIAHGMNFFGLPLAAGDHQFTDSNFATKIYSAGVALRGYVGMDPYAIGQATAGTPTVNGPNALSATPYVYLIPVGTDYLLAPPLGDTGVVRAFGVRDQALPLPFNLGATQFSSNQFVNANGTLSEQPWILRKHQAFRAVADPAFFFSSLPAEFTSSRLVGRSVWNGGWKLVIPAYTLLNNEQEGLNRLVASVKDIELFLRTYSHSGN